MANKFKNISTLVKNTRKNLSPEMSQFDLAEKLGYKNGQFISNVERGLCGVPPKNINPLSIALSVGPDIIKEAMVKDYEETLDQATK